MISVLRPPSRAWPPAWPPALLAVGCIGTYRYLANYWTYRGFAPPKDAAFVKVRGHRGARLRREPGARGAAASRSTSTSRPGTPHPSRRYPVLYLLHGVPGRPGAFL